MESGDLQISINLNLSDEDVALLREAAGLRPADDIAQFLAGVARAATEMFIPELLGRAEYPTKTAARQTRLLKLVQHVFANEMPSSAVVAALFHLTPSAASALMTSTGARYAPELKAARAASAMTVMKRRLKVSQWDDSPVNYRYQFACSDPSVVVSLREELATSPEAITNVARSRDTTNVFEIDGTALKYLARRWQMEVRDFVHPTDHAAWDKKVAKAKKDGKGTP